jgi:hypothetical protein
MLAFSIDGRRVEAPKKILTADQLLELAGLPAADYNVYLVYDGRSHQIDSHEGIEIQGGMAFTTTRKPGQIQR